MVKAKGLKRVLLSSMLLLKSESKMFNIFKTTLNRSYCFFSAKTFFGVILLDLKVFFLLLPFLKQRFIKTLNFFYSDWTVTIELYQLHMFHYFFVSSFYIMCASFFPHFGLVCNKVPQSLGCEKPLLFTNQKSLIQLGIVN